MTHDPTPIEPVAIPAAPPGTPEPRYSFVERWGGLFHTIDLALPVGLLALAFLVSSFAIRNSDIWQHLAAGKMLLDGTYTFGVDPFSFNTADRYWVNHSWLFDIGIFGLFTLGEGAALVVAKSLVVVLIIALIFFQRPQSQPAWVWAWFATLALLTMAPRLFLQSPVLSFAFTIAITTILVHGRFRAGSVRLPILVALLCALWANCDQWFFLGPIIVILFTIGEIVQQRLSPRSEGESNSAKMLAITAIASLAITLVNPHHFHVWTLPAELVSSELTADIEPERLFRELLQTPFDRSFYSASITGNILNPAAYFALLFLSAVGIGLNYNRLRWGHVLVWAAMAVLSFSHARAVSFFAVVAAPLAASIWCQLGAEFASKVKAIGNASIGFGMFARFLTGLAGLGLLFMAWPGWLNANATSPVNARRVAFTIDVEPSMVRFGEQMSQWRKEGLLPEDVRGFHTQPNLSNALAWFCPEEKVSFDSRFTLHAPDAAEFVEFRQTLRTLAKLDDDTARKGVRRLMSERGYRYIVFYSNPQTRDADEITLASRLLWLDPDWTMWYMDGRTIVFGWRDSTRPPSALDQQLAKLKFDPVKQAFAGDTRVPPPNDLLPPADPGFTRRYLFPPPTVPLEVDEAISLDLYAEVLTQLTRARFETEMRLRSFLVGPASFFAVPPPIPDELLALPILAVRAARTATALSPDDPNAHYALALAYQRMETLSDVKQLQMLTAYTRCQERSPKPEQATPFISQIPTRVTQRLMELRLQMSQYDLALKDLKRLLRYLELAPSIAIEPKEITERIKFYKEQMRWRNLPPDELIGRLDDEYENASSRQGSVAARVALARNFGLWGEALDVYQKAVADGRLAEEFGPNQLSAGLDLINLEIMTGRIEQAMNDFNGLLEKDGIVSIDHLPNDPNIRNMARERFVIGLWLSGNYERAGEELDVLLRAEPLNQSPEVKSKLLQQSLIGLMNHWPTSEIIAVENMAGLIRLAQSLGEQHIRRGLLSLEAGDNKTARIHFEAALKPAGIEIFFPNQYIAREYLRVLPK